MELTSANPNKTQTALSTIQIGHTSRKCYLFPWVEYSGDYFGSCKLPNLSRDTRISKGK